MAQGQVSLTPIIGANSLRKAASNPAEGVVVETRGEPLPVPIVLGAFPLSAAQENLWLFEQVASGTTAYHLPEGWRLKGRLNVGALQRSLDQLTQRHESLRTRFSVRDGQPCQEVLASGSFELAVVARPSASEEELEALVDVEVRRPFDLRRGPLARATLFRVGPEDHFLLLNLHHIIGDGWSQGVLMRELAECYRAAIAGTAPVLPELPIQYGDFAVWDRTRMTGQTFEEQVSFWREKLHAPLPLLELHTDHPRPPRQSYRGETFFTELPPALVEGLRELSRREGATLFMTLLAGFKALLQRYTRQQDVIVGCPLSGREQVETEGLIGCFTRLQAMRTGLGGDPSVLELLARVRTVVLETSRHHEISVEQLLRALQIQPDPSRHPLFQVIFGLQSASPDHWVLPELEATRVELHNGASKFDWTLLLTPAGNGLRARCEYNPDLFDAGTMRGMVAHFERVLEGIVARPAQRVSELPLLSPAEQGRLLSRGAARAAANQGECVHGWFERQVESAPDATAISFEEQSLSYRALNQQANQLAHYLRQLGVTRRTLVALYLERSMRPVIAMLGVLKAGGAYVPIDPAYPKDRLAFILEDTAAAVVLTEESLRDALPPGARQIVCLDTESASIASYPTENPPAVGTPEDTAYVIYTSGSTGRPKGVLVTHCNITRLFRSTEGWFGFNAADVWSFFHSYAFDFSVWEIWGALLHGGRLVVVPYLVSRSPQEFYELLVREKVTVLNQTPSAFRQLVWAEGGAREGRPLALRYVIFGGEALEMQMLGPWFDRHGDTTPTIINMYGITETTVHVTYRVIRQADLERHAGSLIGVPIPDLSLYLLDEKLNPVPPGVPGEIFVGGAGVAQGYLNRPELTGQRFIEDRFGAKPGGRLYRSGDLARYNSQGELEYLGRIDQQVKIRGFRVEPGEIEAALDRHPAVRESAVMAVDGPAGDKRLAAYLAPCTTAPSEAELRQFLAQQLPDYMIPATFTVLTHLPLTSNGKLDRRALPQPETNSHSSAPAIAPRNHLEELIAQTWCELLDRPALSMEDNFFQLGGHSLLATQVISRLAAALGLELSVRLLFDFPSVAGLAQAIERAQKQAPAASAIIGRGAAGQSRELLERLEELTDEEVEALLADPSLKEATS